MSFGRTSSLLDEVFKKLGGSVGHLGEHQRGRLLQSGIKLGVVTLEVLESLVEKLVLHHHQFHTRLEACTAKLARALGVESGCLYQIEARISLDRLLYLLYDLDFIFLFHFLSCFVRLVVETLGINLDARAHRARKINALDIGAFGGSGLQLDQSVDKLLGVVFHLLCSEAHLAYRGMNDTVLVYLEVDLAASLPPRQPWPHPWSQCRSWGWASGRAPRMRPRAPILPMMAG